MSDAEDNVSPVRKTRSGRPLKNTPAKAKASPKTPGRRTRKKVVVVEVEVTDEEEMEQVTDFNEPIAKKPKVDTIDEEIDEYTALEQVIINDVEMLDEASEEAVKNGKDENIMVQSDDQIPDESETQEVSNSKDSEDLINEEELLREPTESVIELSEETPLDDSIINDEESFDPKQNIEYLDEEETAAVVETRIEDIEMPKEVPNGDPEAENISDEELPGVPIVKVPETEEVSDEELPGPKRAELPADTEVVSEDELPSTKKDAEDEADNKNIKISEKEAESGYDPTSPTSESESALKKKAEKDEKEKDDTTKTSKPKKLPELEKYWKAVNDDPTDFTGWTYLLQYVDQENDMEAAREAYAAFLSHYPYCYGYWRKFADYEKRKGNKKKCEEVFERGLKAIPLSVDLWIHYLTYVKSSKGDDEEFVRSQFELALAKCGLEFRSDRLWESYIKWETDGKRLQRVTGVYDRLITTPTQNYTVHFDNFQEHVSSNSPNKILEVDEFMALRKEVRGMLKTAEDQKVAESGPDLPPGDEDTKLYTTEEETKCIRERIVSIRRKMHKNTVNAVTVRWNFEEGIKRPYFHVKPLERCQLKNWQDYLDYEIEQGDKTRIIVLFERCLIACALYEDFWLKFVHYLETLQDPEQEMIRDVYERACTIHHLKKPNLHLQWAAFEETCSNNNRAAEILVNLEKQIPNILQVAYRRINLERRKSNFDKCVQLFEHYINGSKNKSISSNMAIKYSRFCHKVLNEFDKAEEILKNAIEKDPNNPRLYLQLIDLTLQKETVPPVDKICAIMDAFLTKETTEIEQKVLFAQRKLEFLEDFGPSVKSVQTALTDFQNYQKLCKEVASKKKEIKADAAAAAAASSTSSSSTKKEKTASTSSAAQSQSYANYNAAAGGTSSSGQTAYSYSGAQQGQYNYGQYGQGDQYQYQGWQYPQSGTYSGYNQWGGYTGGYTY